MFQGVGVLLPTVLLWAFLTSSLVSFVAHMFVHGGEHISIIMGDDVCLSDYPLAILNRFPTH
jgi:hypothetical protein